MNPVPHSSIFEPRELAFLQSLFHDVCVERGLEGESMAAKNLAAQIIDLYQQGIRDKDSLQIRLDGIQPYHG